MSIADEFSKLQVLHEDGVLTDVEFANAKAKVLASEQPREQSDAVQQDIRRLQIQNEIVQLDQRWAQERQRYLLRGRYGAGVVPTANGNIAGAVMLFVAALFMILVGANVPRESFLILFGLLGIICVVWSTANNSAKVTAYDAAYDRYQRRRGELTAQLNRKSVNLGISSGQTGRGLT